MWTVAETRATLEVQVAHMVSCNIPIVFFPPATLVENIPELPKGFKSYADDRGLFYYNPYVISISKLNSSLAELLGHVQTIEEATSNGVPLVVQAVLEGVVAQDSLVDSCDEDALHMQAHIFRVRFPGCTIVHKLPEQVLWNRTKELRNGS